MKYEYYPKRRTEQERRELNEQILRLLQSEACEQAGVTDEDIFNRYTGDGGLHGLRRSDYENYNAFSAAKKELENGQFFTPPPLCEMIVSALRLSDTDLVADLTCGMGNFFNFLPNERNAYGCEVDPNACAVARKLYPQAHIVQGDIRDYEPQTHFDFVLGNPPFHLRWVMPDATVMTSHQYYCLKAAKLLKPLGILAVIVPASFLADSFSDKGAIRMMESQFSFLGQVMLPEHTFSDSGVDGFPTKLQFWQKKSTAVDWAPKRYSTDCADIYIPSGHPVMAATALYEKFVMVAKADLAGNRNKVFLELAQLKTTKSTFLYQVKKYLYQIRSHPVTREKYDACFAYVHRFYSYDKRSEYMEHKENPYYGMPIPAYKKGYRLFANSHLPEKITVFGVGQRNQDIYNADELDRLLGKTVITRTFEEVTGKDIRRIHQMPIPFLPEEREVYNIVLKEFYRIQREYYSSTGNSRKDALMRLIQQITLLLRISAAPDCMKEYEGETPLKEMAVVEALARWPEEVVAIGVRHTTVLDRYAAAIREYLPERPLFVVTGSTVTFAKRRALRDILRDSQNGILLCTQQSLPSSVNFEFVNKIIIPEMHYNNAGMSQFYMRFVRYTSTEKKDLYFPIYIGSLESNLMQMVLAKEKLTMFMKGQDADMDEIYAKFGVDYDLLSTLMTRETDDEGHLRIHWGEQKIA